jgi:hypothetical protein
MKVFIPRGYNFVDVELAGAGADVFPAGGTTEHLSVYDALLDDAVGPAATLRQT